MTEWFKVKNYLGYGEITTVSEWVQIATTT